jgi:CheY-like chemotaxis protein
MQPTIPGASGATPAPPPAELPEILLVEDEDTPRRELKRALTRKGFRVREAVNGDEAIQQADDGDVGLVLMDILLGDGPDGIEAAQQIQQAHPDTSVIFVSAYAHDPDTQQRAERVPRIGGWIDKPIRVASIRELLRIANKELVKSRLRGQLQGEDSLRQLDELARRDPSLSPEVVEELGRELREAGEPSPPVPATQEELEMQIDAVYDEIRALVASRAGDPGLARAIRPLRRKLRALQEQEAELMEARFLSHFHFDPAEGGRLIQRARRLLRKR